MDSKPEIDDGIVQRMCDVMRSATDAAREGRWVDVVGPILQTKKMIQQGDKNLCEKIRQLFQIEEFCDLLITIIRIAPDDVKMEALACCSNIIHCDMEYGNHCLNLNLFELLMEIVQTTEDLDVFVQIIALLHNLMPILEDYHRGGIIECIVFDELLDTRLDIDVIISFLEGIIKKWDFLDTFPKIVEYASDLIDVVKSDIDDVQPDPSFSSRLYLTYGKRDYYFARIILLMGLLVVKHDTILLLIWEANIVQSIIEFCNENTLFLRSALITFFGTVIEKVAINPALLEVGKQIVREARTGEIIDWVITGFDDLRIVRRGMKLVLGFILEHYQEIDENLFEERRENHLMQLVSMILSYSGEPTGLARMTYDKKKICIDFLARFLEHCPIEILTEGPDIPIATMLIFAIANTWDDLDELASDVLAMLRNFAGRLSLSSPELKACLVENLAEADLISRLEGFESDDEEATVYARQILEIVK